MKIIRLFVLCIPPLLGLLLAACAASPLPAAPSPQAADPRPPLPPPLKVVHEERLAAQRDPRFPPPDFGKSIALGDGVLAVGAPSITGGTDFSAPGSVYVYRRSAGGWAEEAQLRASDQDDGFQYAQHFGEALALQGDLLFVGAPAADDPQAGDNTGAVYVFEHGVGGWEEIAILRSPQPAAEAGFGSQLAIGGEHLGVLEGGYAQGGPLRLFQGQGRDWRPTAVIEAPPPAGQQGGIAAFDLYGDTLAVGTMAFEGEGADAIISGEVRLYRFDGATWTSSESLPPEVIGLNLTLDGQGTTANRLAVASQMNPLNGFMSGAVSIFERGAAGWKLAETLASPDAGSAYWGSGYGGSVALNGDLLLVGGPGFSEDTHWDGVAYLYQLNAGHWVDQLRLNHTEDGGFGDFFGSQVAVFGKTLLVSAPDEFGNAVYVFEVSEK